MNPATPSTSPAAETAAKPAAKTDAEAAAHAARAASFDGAAEVYERSRPGYPAEAVAWLTESVPSGGRVLDLGAGTGKFTRAIVPFGFEVLAVDPSPRMLEQLAAAVPGVETLLGTAEALPLPDASVDAVLIAQAWHWVDAVPAVAELRRVLKPGGVFGPVWNIRRSEGGWMAELDDIIHPSDSDRAVETLMHEGGLLGPASASFGASGFGPVDHRVIEWEQPIDVEVLVELVSSRSEYLTSDEATQRGMRDAVRRLAATHPDLAGRTEFAMPYATHAFRTHRR